MTANWEASPDRTPKDESAAALGSIQDEETGDLSCADGAVIRPLSPTKNNMSLQEEALDPICLVGNGVIFLNKDPLTASKIAIIAFWFSLRLRFGRVRSWGVLISTRYMRGRLW